MHIAAKRPRLQPHLQTLRQEMMKRVDEMPRPRIAPRDERIPAFHRLPAPRIRHPVPAPRQRIVVPQRHRRRIHRRDEPPRMLRM